MDKPINLSIKDFLIRRMAVQLMTSEKTIEAVISHQFKSANEALDKNSSIEIAGFGKWLFNHKKAKKVVDSLNINIASYEERVKNMSEEKRASSKIVERLSYMKEMREHLNKKLCL